MAANPDRTPPEVLVGAGLSPLTSEEFKRLRDLIFERSGITLGDSKMQLVASRLARRLRNLGLTRYGDYYEHVLHRDADGSELREMLNAITTNKTDFFREPHHFEFLRTKFLPACIERSRTTNERRFRVWSAGCSSGEEPYTLAMVLKSALPAGWSAEILATDLDTQVLARAQAGVYSEDAIAPVPEEMRRRFLRRGTGENAGKVRVHEELRQMITFQQLNFIEQPWAVRGPFDLILCRNVMIYFNAATQRTIVEGFAERVREDGYLFIGHSETLHGVNHLFEALRGTIYRRRRIAETAGLAPEPGATAPHAAGHARPIQASADAGASVADASSTFPPRPAFAERPTLAKPVTPAARPLPPVPAASPVVRSASRPRDERNLERLNVIIGGVRASAKPVELRTVLGSCVCACIHDPVARIGGINHFMLPDGLEDRAMPTRFGVNAMEVLINEILKLGGDRRRLQAKAFGAAHVLSDAGLSADVPRKNAKFIKEFLENEGIPLMSSRLGGSAPVEVIFMTDTGKAFVRALGDSVARDLAREESRHDLEIRKQLVVPQAGTVELF